MAVLRLKSGVHFIWKCQCKMKLHKKIEPVVFWVMTIAFICNIFHLPYNTYISAVCLFMMTMYIILLVASFVSKLFRRK